MRRQGTPPVLVVSGLLALFPCGAVSFAQEIVKTFTDVPCNAMDWSPDLDDDGHWDLIVGDGAYDVGPI